MSTSRLGCPVCLVRFRGSRICPRCGADLTPLMRLIAAAWHARTRARQALAEGDPAAAMRHAEQAQSLHATQSGGRLLMIAQWLSTAT